jgi:uncharacterized protein YajQ (UPF0234 family)
MLIMPSFDIVSSARSKSGTRSTRPTKEVSARFDFKGSDARRARGKTLTIYADDDFKQTGHRHLTGKLTKRSVDVRSLKYGDVEKISGNR